jgi:hypothetical protein
VSDLSEHFQAGRLTAGELDERTGRALAARTWGELRELLARKLGLRVQVDVGPKTGVVAKVTKSRAA